MKKRSTKLAAMLLTLAMLLSMCPVTAMAADTFKLTVTITDAGEEATGNEVSDSTSYLTGDTNLVTEIGKLVADSYFDENGDVDMESPLRGFASNAMRAKLEKGLEAYKNSGDWERFVTREMAGAEGDLLPLVSDFRTTLSEMEDGREYSITYTNAVAGDAKEGVTYTITAELTKRASSVTCDHTTKTREENRKPATCEKDGSYDLVTYCTKCNVVIKTEKKTIPAIGHKYDAGKVTTKPTCTTDGVKTFTCQNDKTHTYTEVIPATGHKYDTGKVTVKPTCTTDGVKTFTCQNDTTHTYTEAIPATGHTDKNGDYKCDVCGEKLCVAHTTKTREENRKEATCDQAGSYDLVTYCTKCGEIIDRETKTIPATGHVDADKNYECDNCGVTLSKPSSHTHTTKTREENRKEATCETAGSYDVVTYCKKCGDVIKRETKTIPAIGHKYDNGKVTVKATCTTDGVKTFTCKNDKAHTKTEIIPATGHTDKNGDYKCNTCGAAMCTSHTTATREENHKEATCQKYGSYDVVTYCTKCGEVIKTEKQFIPALGHVDADKNGTCDNCGKSMSNVLDKPLVDFQPANDGDHDLSDHHDHDEVKPGDKVTIELEPEDGHRTNRVQVTDQNGNPVKITALDNDTYTFVVPVGGVTVTSTFIQNPTPVEETGVDRMLNTEEPTAYIQGKADGNFHPTDSITRGQVATIFYRLLKPEYANTDSTKAFNDVPTDFWCADAVNTLATLGIVNGMTDEIFDPNKPITRAQFVAICARFADVSIEGEDFHDVPENHWAYDYISTGSGFGWVNGVGGGAFDPNAPITRAQAVAIVNRMLCRIADRAAVDAQNEQFYHDVESYHWAWYDIGEASLGNLTRE